jgi:hypothetical protein
VDNTNLAQLWNGAADSPVLPSGFARGARGCAPAYSDADTRDDGVLTCRR